MAFISTLAESKLIWPAVVSASLGAVSLPDGFHGLSTDIGGCAACRDDPTIFSINLMNEPRCECHPPHIPLPANYTVLPSCQARAQRSALRTHNLHAPAQVSHLVIR